jgi:general L-amino acid transport system substrate-binding protein
MLKRSLLLSIVAGLLLSLTGVAVLAQDAVQVGPITQRVIDRGRLICGVNANVRGFGFVNDEGQYEGFDIDFCRAVAAAILGDADAVDYRPLTGAERQAAIQSGEIDMMARNTTFTLSRDVVWTSSFGPTNFYDGQGVMTLGELGATAISDLDGASMCVQQGTTTELNITDYVEANGLNIEIQVYPDANTTWEAYIGGRCQAWTTDKSGLASFRLSAEDPGAHVILAETISKEPLGPLSPQDDEQFATIIRWTVYGLIQAEEYGINSQNISEYAQADGESDEAYNARVTPEVARFLGLGGNQAGSYLGLPENFMVTVISTVGNYGEIYERHLTPIGLERAGTLNDLWTRGGLLYSPPFR